ncbi:MAG: hypothetical protein KAJ24_07335, partial [Candidatus Aenigmarchaeota archaeon]|nr:hypothetical protein [Candidatus Aenigmarchaeota archaeon]
MNKIAIVPMLFVAILLHCSSAFADPAVFFIPPTPDDGTTITETYATIKVTATDVNNITAFIDWNNSLVGWWRFNNDTDFKDYSTYSNDGTNSGSAYTTAGKFGGARAFDGADDYIDAGTATSLSITEEITIEAWIKATESQWNNAKQTIVSKWAHATTTEFQDTVNYDVYNAQNEDGANGMVGFAGAVFDGRYVYFVPNYNGTTHGKVLRYDTAANFSDTASWDVYNAENEDGANGMKGFVGAVFDGRHIYFVPNYHEGWYGTVLRLDTTANFSDTASWDTYNAENEDGANGMKGFTGAVFDGRHIYFVPYNNGTYFGKVLRYDTTASFSDTASWDVYNAENEDGANGMKG